jgi:hypothetical protein
MLISLRWRYLRGTTELPFLDGGVLPPQRQASRQPLRRGAHLHCFKALNHGFWSDPESPWREHPDDYGYRRTGDRARVASCNRYTRTSSWHMVPKITKTTSWCAPGKRLPNPWPAPLSRSMPPKQTQVERPTAVVDSVIHRAIAICISCAWLISDHGRGLESSTRLKFI